MVSTFHNDGGHSQGPVVFCMSAISERDTRGTAVGPGQSPISDIRPLLRKDGRTGRLGKLSVPVNTMTADAKPIREEVGI